VDTQDMINREALKVYGDLDLNQLPSPIFNTKD
jgi:hypothetical protein